MAGLVLREGIILVVNIGIDGSIPLDISFNLLSDKGIVPIRAKFWRTTNKGKPIYREVENEQCG
jgi:hypothetical protein